MAAPMRNLRLWNRSRCSGIYNCITRQVHTSPYIMAAHDAEFQKAKERLNSLKEDPGNEVKLKLYGLFKQATVGKCNTPKPGMMDMVGKYKWNAWNDLGDLSQDASQQQYVDVVTKLAGAESNESAPPTVEGDSSQFETLAIDNTDGVYRITLNRPSKKNAITYQMYEDWVAALQEAADDESVVLATVTGAGDYFCSGNDLGNFANIPPEGMQGMAEKGGQLLLRFVSAFIDFPKPLIGLVNGPAVGVSVTTLGLYDAVYATDRATFHTPFTLLGQSAEGCSSYIFPKLMGRARASELLLFNKKISAAEAFSRNLITEVIPDDLFAKVTAAKINKFSKLPKQSLQSGKVLMRQSEKETLHNVNKEECELLLERWVSDECVNAIMNFFQQKSSKL